MYITITNLLNGFVTSITDQINAEAQVPQPEKAEYGWSSLELMLRDRAWAEKVVHGGYVVYANVIRDGEEGVDVRLDPSDRIDGFFEDGDFLALYAICPKHADRFETLTQDEQDLLMKFGKLLWLGDFKVGGNVAAGNIAAYVQELL